jgi:hypothetical protein
MSSFIHFSRTSQPPRLTPRRKGILVLAGGDGVTGVDVELGLELLLLERNFEEVVEVIEETLDVAGATSEVVFGGSVGVAIEVVALSVKNGTEDEVESTFGGCAEWWRV